MLCVHKQHLFGCEHQSDEQSRFVRCTDANVASYIIRMQSHTQVRTHAHHHTPTFDLVPAWPGLPANKCASSRARFHFTPTTPLLPHAALYHIIMCPFCRLRGCDFLIITANVNLITLYTKSTIWEWHVFFRLHNTVWLPIAQLYRLRLSDIYLPFNKECLSNDGKNRHMQAVIGHVLW